MVHKDFVGRVLEKFNCFPISTIFSHLLRAWVKIEEKNWVFFYFILFYFILLYLILFCISFQMLNMVSALFLCQWSSPISILARFLILAEPSLDGCWEHGRWCFIKMQMAKVTMFSLETLTDGICEETFQFITWNFDILIQDSDQSDFKVIPSKRD